MSNPIKFTDILDLSDGGQIEKAIKALSDYQRSVASLTATTAELSRQHKSALDGLSKSVTDHAGILKAANSATREGQEQIAKSVQVVERATKVKKELADADKLLTEKAVALAKTQEDLAAMQEKLAKASEKAEKGQKAQAGSLDELKARVLAAKKEFEGLGSAVDAVEKTKALDNYAKLKKELDETNKATRDAAKASGAAEGSIVSLRDKLSKLTAQWNALSKEERENAKVGGVIQKQAKDTSDELKKLEQAVGDNRRSVGDYTGGILKAIDGTGLLATITMKAKAAQEVYTATLQIAKASLVGNISLLKAFKLALAATGIGAVVLLLGGLVSWLTRTQEGLDWLSAKTKGVTTVFGVLTDKLSAVGKAVIDFFSGVENLGDLFTKVGQLLKDQLIARLEAFGVILKAIQSGNLTKVADGFVQLTIGVRDLSEKAENLKKELVGVAKAGEAIERETQRIRDAERALNVERAKSRAEVKAYKLIAEDVTKSEKERVNAARKALGIEQALVDKQVKLQEQKIANIKAEQALTNNLTADNDLLAQEEVRLSDLKGESFEKQVELQNKLNALTKESAAKRLADAQARIKEEQQLEQDRIALAENRLNREILLLAKQTENEKVSQLELNGLLSEMAGKRIAIAQLERDKKLLAVKQGTDAERLILEQFAAIVEDINAELAKGITFNPERANKALIDQAKAQYLELEKLRAQGLVTEQEYADKKKEIDEDLYRKSIENLKAAAGFEGKVLDEELAYYKKINDDKAASDKELSSKKAELLKKDAALEKQLKKEIADASIDLVNAVFDREISNIDAKLRRLSENMEREMQIVGDNAEAKMMLEDKFAEQQKELQKEQIKAQRRQAIFNKAVALFEIAVQTGVKVMEAFPNPILMAAAKFVGILQAGIILAKPIPQYFTGTPYSKEGLALVGERGRELVQTPSGSTYLTPDKPTLTYLEGGSKVFTKPQTDRMLSDLQLQQDISKSYAVGADTLRRTAPVPIDLGQVQVMIQQQSSRDIDRLIKVIQAKETVHLNIDEKGLNKYLKRGDAFTEILNKRFNKKI